MLPTSALVAVVALLLVAVLVAVVVVVVVAVVSVVVFVVAVALVVAVVVAVAVAVVDNRTNEKQPNCYFLFDLFQQQQQLFMEQLWIMLLPFVNGSCS